MGLTHELHYRLRSDEKSSAILLPPTAKVFPTISLLASASMPQRSAPEANAAQPVLISDLNDREQPYVKAPADRIGRLEALDAFLSWDETSQRWMLTSYLIRDNFFLAPCSIPAHLPSLRGMRMLVQVRIDGLRIEATDVQSRSCSVMPATRYDASFMEVIDLPHHNPSKQEISKMQPDVPVTIEGCLAKPLRRNSKYAYIGSGDGQLTRIALKLPLRISDSQIEGEEGSTLQNGERVRITTSITRPAIAGVPIKRKPLEKLSFDLRDHCLLLTPSPHREAIFLKARQDTSAAFEEIRAFITASDFASAREALAKLRCKRLTVSERNLTLEVAAAMPEAERPLLISPFKLATAYYIERLPSREGLIWVRAALSNNSNSTGMALPSEKYFWVLLSSGLPWSRVQAHAEEAIVLLLNAAILGHSSREPNPPPSTKSSENAQSATETKKRAYAKELQLKTTLAAIRILAMHWGAECVDFLVNRLSHMLTTKVYWQGLSRDSVKSHPALQAVGKIMATLQERFLVEVANQSSFDKPLTPVNQTELITALRASKPKLKKARQQLFAILGEAGCLHVLNQFTRLDGEVSFFELLERVKQLLRNGSYDRARLELANARLAKLSLQQADRSRVLREQFPESERPIHIPLLTVSSLNAWPCPSLLALNKSYKFPIEKLRSAEFMDLFNHATRQECPDENCLPHLLTILPLHGQSSTEARQAAHAALEVSLPTILRPQSVQQRGLAICPSALNTAKAAVDLLCRLQADEDEVYCTDLVSRISKHISDLGAGSTDTPILASLVADIERQVAVISDPTILCEEMLKAYSLQSLE